jgi:hypothetical protein
VNKNAAIKPQITKLPLVIKKTIKSIKHQTKMEKVKYEKLF